MKYLKLILLSSLIIFSATSFALTNTTENTNSTISSSNNNNQSNIVATHNEYLATQITQSIFEKLSSEQQQAISSMWGLSVTDYSHYLWLMSNTTNGIYYADKNLDPNWVLGMNATSEQEQQKYAVIAIKNERARIQKELTFQREFTRLAKELFPNEKPIDIAAAYDDLPAAKPMTLNNRK